MSQQPGELPGFDALSPQDRTIKAQLASPQGVSQLFDNQEELDKAAAEASLHAWAPKGAGEPEWSVGQLMVERDGVFWIADVVRFRGNAVDGANRISQPAEKAERQAPIFFEGEEGVSGKIVIDNDQRLVPPVIAMRGTRPAAAKNVRALPVFGGFRGWAHQVVTGAAEHEVSNPGGDDLRQDGGTRRPARGGRSRHSGRGQRRAVQRPLNRYVKSAKSHAKPSPGPAARTTFRHVRFARVANLQLRTREGGRSPLFPEHTECTARSSLAAGPQAFRERFAGGC